MIFVFDNDKNMKCHHATLYVFICIGSMCDKSSEVKTNLVLSFSNDSEVSVASDILTSLNMSPNLTCAHKTKSVPPW